MPHLVFNSFPRSGNVFLSNVARQAFSMEMSAAHMPEIFGVEALHIVSIFRNPADAIASLVNKTREHSPILDGSGVLDQNKVFHTVQRSIDTYDRYIDGVSQNLDKVEIVLFEDLIHDYVPVVQSIADRFGLATNDGYQERVNLDKSSDIWLDKYDGHMPREKDQIRLNIETLVSSMDTVARLIERYTSLLKKQT